MRTAVTLAQGHDGKWRVISDPSVPLVEQFNTFRHARVDTSHNEFQRLRYQEADGEAMEILYRSPEAEKAHNDRRAEEAKEAAALLDKERAKAEKVRKEIEQARAKDHKDFIKETDEQHLSDPNRTGGKPTEPEAKPTSAKTK